ncbi:MAG: SIR2 family protein [Paludibaculum sp.]
MSTYHDPMRQCNYLHQSLVQDKLPIGLFLGAGCPFSICPDVGQSNVRLIPDIAGLTAAVNTALSGTGSGRVSKQIYSHFAEDNRPVPTIEQFLGHVRALAQVVGAKDVRGITAIELEALDLEICRQIVKITNVSLPPRRTPYHDVAAWIGSTQRESPVEIFTTNYDLLMEEALEEYRAPFFDGFVGSREPFFDTQAIEDDPLPVRWVRLWKLHGSINWRQGSNGRVYRTRLASHNQEECYIIHPSHLKYAESRRMPYLAMIDRLRAFLRRRSCLLIVSGYSFGDEHLNEVLLQGLFGNASASVFALMFGSIHSLDNKIRLDRLPANLSVLASSEAIVGGIRAPWQLEYNIDYATENEGLEWVGDPTIPGKRCVSFQLGDFVRFGSFLSALVGRRGLSGSGASPIVRQETVNG